MLSLLYRRAVLIGALSLALAPSALQARQSDNGIVFKAESQSVLVDAVVTDKHGIPIRDLAQKDFRGFEDGKEQVLRSFSFETEGNSNAPSQRRYLVLFFDNTSMGTQDQFQARKAAAQFVEANAGPNRLMAVVNYSGVLRMAVNFTSDVKRLEQVVTGGNQQSPIQTNVSPDLASNDARFGAAMASFASRNVLNALRQLAKGLADVPGRKTVVFLSDGFPLTPELTSELSAAVDACNRANVAIYPIDVRGL